LEALEEGGIAKRRVHAQKCHGFVFEKLERWKEINKKATNFGLFTSPMLMIPKRIVLEQMNQIDVLVLLVSVRIVSSLQEYTRC